MATILTAITPAAIGASAVRARFLMVRNEITVNGTVVRVTGVATSKTHRPGQTVIDGRDAEGRTLTVVIPSDQMVELYDRDAANATLAALIAA